MARPIVPTLTPEQSRKARAAAFASTLGVDGDALFRAAMAVWSNLNPQRTSFDRALSVAGSALRAAAEPSTPEANPG